MLTNQPVVIDNGSGITKCGFAGEDQPKFTFPSLMGIPKHHRIMAGALEGDTFIGNKAQEQRGLMKLVYPMRHGMVERWDDMEKIWEHSFSLLNILSEDHPVLLTEVLLDF